LSVSERWQEIRGGFERPFWIANLTELFERLAFYAPKAVLTLYLVETLHFSRTDAGKLTGIFGFVVWFLPVLGGAIADKFGFKRTLASAYLILTLGYFLLGSIMSGFLAPIRDAVPMYWFVLGVLMVPALGPGIVKPIVAGTTARASTEAVRSLGFSIYYTIVNIGGMLGPLVAYQVRTTIGIENVFRVSALTTLAMFFVTLVFFKEPERGAAEPQTFGQSLKKMLVVFGNLRFMSFLIIFSGFYIVFWQQWVAMPLFLQDVNPSANADLLLSVDPATVVLLTVPVGILLRKAPAFPTIIAGVLIASLSWLILTTGGSTIHVILTLFVLAMGELILSPKYYDYVSRLAPAGQTATFMGFSFMPVAVGDLVGSPLGGWLAQRYGQELHTPHRMWFVVTAIGLATVVLLLLYDRLVTRKVAPSPGPPVA
jgi:POT family proton-dependent oligopeptide transporter